MLRLFIIGLLLTTLFNKNVIGQNLNSKDTLLTMLTFGATDATREHAVNVAAKEFGFRYYLVNSYCSPFIVVNDSSKNDYSYFINTDSINKHNDTVSNLIANKYGKGWKDKMTKEGERLLSNEQKVQDLILSDTTVTNLREDFADDAEQGLIRFITDETQTKNNFLVSITTQMKKGDKYEVVVIYKLSVDIRKKTIKILSNKVETLYNRS